MPTSKQNLRNEYSERDANKNVGNHGRIFLGIFLRLWNMTQPCRFEKYAFWSNAPTGQSGLRRPTPVIDLSIACP